MKEGCTAAYLRVRVKASLTYLVLFVRSFALPTQDWTCDPYLNVCVQASSAMALYNTLFLVAFVVFCAIKYKAVSYTHLTLPTIYSV